MKFRHLIFRISLFIAVGSSYSICAAMELSCEVTSVELARPFYEDLPPIWEETCEMSLSDGSKSTLSYSIKPYPKNCYYYLRPTCSILMSNGAQIDYQPKMGAFWLTRELDLKNTATVTGTINERNLYGCSAEEFSEILMKASAINGARPVHVTFSNGKSYPIKHPESVRGEVLRKWLEEKI